MLEHLSPKFKMPPVEREPRAALILNRFTRNLTIMFATNAVASVLGLAPDQIKDKSFYRCIQERCLPDALNCLESAKANDSIAYLRFWSRDPREENDFDDAAVEDEDEDMGDGEAASSTSDSEEGGAAVGGQMDVDSRGNSSPEVKKEDEDISNMRFLPSALSASGGSSGQGSSAMGTAASSRSGNHAAVYETPVTNPSPAQPAAVDGHHVGRRPRNRRPQERQALPSIELEAVVSCTSDGLVVILRRARPAIPPAHPPLVLPPWEFENGLFAAPWAQQPVRPYVPPEMLYTFRAPLLPQYMPLRENVKAAGGPPIDHLMRSIRDVAVFAWALVGINGNFASFSHGRPLGEAAPPGGLPIWDPSATGSAYQPPDNQAAARWAAYDQNMMDNKGKGPAVPQSLPDPYYSATSSSAAAYESAARRHDAPPPPYAMENYGMYGAARPRPQQPAYDAAADHRYMPPPPQQTHERQQQHHHHHQNSYPPSGAASQTYQPHSWANGLVGLGRSSGPPGAAQGSSAVHTSQQQQPPDQGQPDSPRDLAHGWRGGPFRD